MRQQTACFRWNIRRLSATFRLRRPRGKDESMRRTMRYEFTGSCLLVLILIAIGFGIPWAIKHVINNTIAVETD